MTTAVQLAQSVAPGVSLGFKNRIINGDLLIWQRGTSFTPALGSLSQYTADRWASYQTGAAAVVNKGAGFNGQPNCLAFNGAASNTEVTMFQCIESNNCADLVGQNITFSVWLYSTVASKSVSLFIDTANTVDTFSATTQKATVAVSVPAATWTQYTLTYSNADSSVANGIRVRMNFGACTSGTYAFTGAQLEVGTAATNFEFRDYGRELIMCQRYYFNNFQASALGATGAYMAGFPRMPVQMRASPTVNLQSGSTIGYDLTGVGSGSITPTTFDNVTTLGFRWYGTFSGSGGVIGYITTNTIQASAEL